MSTTSTSWTWLADSDQSAGRTQRFQRPQSYKTRRGEIQRGGLTRLRNCHAKTPTSPGWDGEAWKQASCFRACSNAKKIPQQCVRTRNITCRKRRLSRRAPSSRNRSRVPRTWPDAGGTDIKLGSGVADRGGLYVIGTERHESAPNRSAVAGTLCAPGRSGASRFYVSFEDDLMRNFWRG